MCDNSISEVSTFLDSDTFAKIVDSTPLIAIDLVVRNASGQILLGLRTNRPAQGFWFVPGGRIVKNESIEHAFKRLTKAELGIEISIANAKYLGLYEHFYNDSVFGAANENKSISTHYVVNGFEVVLPALEGKLASQELPKEQHEDYRWLSETELLAAPNVHVHSKWYFNKDKGFL
ncbi:MAG: GDP-mannose mannosyl hydrolase [Colwellia sp.]